MENKTEIAVFGGGCFWCTEAIFRMLKGVTGVMPGYAGGTMKNPTYEDVCSGKTGHAEVIKIDFDPALISYETLLTVFFATHDPTTPGRQGADVGPQYRSVILYTDDDQKQTAERYIAGLNTSSAEGAPITTEVKPLGDFYPAERYHQNYYAKNPSAPYCEVIINPKLKKAQKQFAALLNEGVTTPSDTA